MENLPDKVVVLSPSLLSHYLDQDLVNIYLKPELLDQLLDVDLTPFSISNLIIRDRDRAQEQWRETSTSQDLTENTPNRSSSWWPLTPTTVVTVFGLSYIDLRDDLRLNEIYLKDRDNEEYVLWMITRGSVSKTDSSSDSTVLYYFAMPLTQSSYFIPITYRSNIITQYLASVPASVALMYPSYEFTVSNGLINRTFFEANGQYHLLEWRTTILRNLHIFEIERQFIVRSDNYPLTDRLKQHIIDRCLNFDVHWQDTIRRSRIHSGHNLISQHPSNVLLTPPVPKIVPTISLDDFLSVKLHSTLTPKFEPVAPVQYSRKILSLKPIHRDRVKGNMNMDCD